MGCVRDEVSIIYAAQWPPFPQTLQTQFRIRRLLSGRSKSSHRAGLLRSVMLAGAQILPVIQADVTERERAIGPGEGGAGENAQWCTTGLDQRESKHAIPAG